MKQIYFVEFIIHVRMKASERHLLITDEQSYACRLISILIQTIIVLVLFHSFIYIFFDFIT